MKIFLKMLFGTIFVWMVVMTIQTSLAVSLWKSWPGFAANPWAVATLWDAYFGFLTFYLWVVYKERKLVSCVVWFLLIMGLGNIAMSFYVLIQLMSLQREDPAEKILWSRKA